MNKAERFSKLKEVAKQQLQNLATSQGQLEALEAQSNGDSANMLDFKKNINGLGQIKLPPPSERWALYSQLLVGLF